MKRIVSFALCSLLSATVPLSAADTSIENIQTTEARDAKTSNILMNVVKVIEGVINIIKIIKDSRPDKENIKLQAKAELADAVASIRNIAAVSLPTQELCQDNIQELCDMLHDVLATIQPLLREYIKDDIASMHDYLQNAPLQELQDQLQTVNQEEHHDIAIASTDEHEKEFHAYIIQALHNLVQNLFSIIQAPENPKIIGQNIADMLSNIINVASQTIKYEYLSSRDAEENVAVYLESFSSELTKEIKHLMLQTALHLRGCQQTRACSNSCSSGCCNSSSSTVCRPCCKPCSTCNLNMEQEDAILRKNSCCSSCSCSPACNSTCSTCNNSCCSRSQQEVKEDTVTRACPSCGCGNCSNGCCSYGTKSSDTTKKTAPEARSNKRRSCKNCSSCGKSSSSCSCKKNVTEDQQADDQTKCGCGAKPKPQQAATRVEKIEDAQDISKCSCGVKPKPQQPITRVDDTSDDTTKCGCGAANSNKPKPNTTPRNNKCCGKPATTQPKPGKLMPRPRSSAKNLIYPEGYNG